MDDRARAHGRAVPVRQVDPLGSARPGRSLDTAIRAAMEPRFGRDFSQVRVHTDTAAADSVRSLGLAAYTVGDDVVFGAGRYAPGTPAGDRLLAHELAHVVQQDRPTGMGTADVAAEGRARLAADAVAAGGAVPPGLVGRAPLGLAADDGKEGPGLPSGALGGRLRISAQLVDDLRKRGLLKPELAAMIARGEILVEPDRPGIPVLPPLGPGTTLGPRATLGFGPLPRSLVGGAQGNAPLQAPVWPPTVPAPGKENWLTSLEPSLKASFSLFEGLTIDNVYRPGTGTTISVAGVTTKLGRTKGGTAGQVEFGWDKTLGFQISRAGWHLHGEANPDGAWRFSLSFPSEDPMPVLPWIKSIFNEGALALRGFADMAGEGLPTGDVDSLVKRASPHVDRIKNAIDAGKGIASTDPRLSASFMIGSGPGPGVTPAEKPSGIFVGGSLILSF